MKPIAILYNDKAGKAKGRQILREIAAILEERRIVNMVYQDDWPTEYSNFSAVWIIGGDGTLNYFINHTMGELPPLAVFPGGTGNDFATLLYGNADTAEIVNVILSAEPRSVDVGICNGQYFLNMAGLGFDGKVLESMNAIRWMGAFWGYYLGIIKAIITFREPMYEIRIDGSDIVREKLLLLLVNNAPNTGGGFRVSPLANIADGKLDLVTCSPLSLLSKIRALPLVRKGKHLDLSYIRHSKLNKMNVTTSRTIYGQLDGELITGSYFEITIKPGHFRFLY